MIDLSIWSSLLIPVIIVLAILFYAFRILREYERGVVFLLGRLWKVKGPGLIMIVPVIQQMVRIDLRTRVLDVPPQDVISRDNVSVRVNAVVYYRVIDPEKAIIQVEHFNEATSQLAQTTLRSVLGQHDLDQMLAEREKLNADIQRILDEQTDAWGIKVSNVELKHVDLNETMIRAIARQAEAERIRRAKVIDAEGEFQAAREARSGRRDSRDQAGGDAAALSHGAAEHRRRAHLDHRVPDPDQSAADVAGELIAASACPGKVWEPVFRQGHKGVYAPSSRAMRRSKESRARHGTRGRTTSSSSTSFSKSLTKISTCSLQRPATGMRKSSTRQKPSPSLTPWRCIGSMPAAGLASTIVSSLAASGCSSGVEQLDGRLGTAAHRLDFDLRHRRARHEDGWKPAHPPQARAAAA